ncbi:acyl-CoA/acyl-ACP dehydrogenase [Plantactinospora sp. S1510]|uniref:Acyl-CoA/acyl-ACP dehydrogenase n=1 Tax=Plantactinospora alkalitolerans TaxID=2789879 RepID=A0ABS0GRN0_9ACTN|nr:acyl-CoA dehydrogenase family protein [Plantactinospora alkalitolerans]MBF9128837.1 acyl-CoA/acyl-ACP dehydrogenase [Plantactinospora alkalitolerans]
MLTAEQVRLRAPSAEQRELAASAAGMFFRPDRDERVDAGPEGDFDRGRWTELAGTGLLGAAVPEGAGGLGLSVPDLVVLTEQAGRALLPGPVVETSWIAAPALAALGQEWAPALAATLHGDRVAAAVDATLRGPDLDVASYVVVPADGSDLLCAADRLGATLRVSTQDRLERSFRIARGPDGGGSAAQPLPLTDGLRVLDRGRLGAAAYLVGVAGGLLEQSISYARLREQFGRPIGAFQAVRHRLADSYVELEFARSAVWGAACDVAEGDPAAPVAITCASVAARRAFAEADRHCLQTHGGIGFTWEHPLHVWLKRGATFAARYGLRRDLETELGERLLARTGQQPRGRPPRPHI